MATFEAQVEGLTSLSIDGSSSPNQTELTQFLTDGAKELINIFSNMESTELLDLCSSSVSFTSGTPNTLNTGKIHNVLRNDGTIDQPCRQISAIYKGRYSDSDDMNYATSTDPLYFLENNTIDVLPISGACTYSEVQYPSVAYGDSAIAVFPDEAEYLVVLYASIKSLENALGNKTSDLPSDLSIAAVPPDVPSITASTVAFSQAAPVYTTPTTTISGTAWATAYPDQYTEVTTAMTAINTELDECLTLTDSANAEIVLANAEVDKATAETSEAAILVDSDIDTATAAISTAAGRINSAVQLANKEFDEVANVTSGVGDSAIKKMRDTAATTLAISDLSIAAVPPDVPTLTAITFSSIDSDIDATSPTFTTATVGSSSIYTGSAPTYTSPTTTISGTAWSTAYPDQYTAITTAWSAINNEIDDCLTIADTMSTELGDALTELDESISLTDSTSSNIQVALDAINTACDKFRADADDPALFGDETQYTTGTGMTLVKDALDNAFDLIDNNQPSSDTDAYGAQANEDIELVSSALSIAQTEIQRAHAHIAEWNAAVQTLISEINGFSSEAKLRYGWIAAKAQVWNGQLAVVQGYGHEIQTRLNTSEAYVKEVRSRLEPVSAKVAEFQSKVQDARNTFDKENIAYQSAIQESFKEIQVANQVNIAQGQSDLQVAIDNENRSQQRRLQNSINDMKAIFDNNNTLILKYQAEERQYQSEVQSEIQEYQQNLQQKSIELDSAIKIQGSYFQEAQAGIAAGNAYLEEAKTSADEAQAYASEVQSRVSQVQAQIGVSGGYLGSAAAFLQTAQGYLSEVQTKIAVSQGYSQEVQTRLSLVPMKVSEFEVLAKDALNVFNDAKVEYDGQLQIAIQNAQLEDAEEGKKLQKYAAELEQYGLEVNAEVQEMVNNLQKHSIDYKWIELRHQKLSADYDRGIQMLVGVSASG